MVLYDQAVYQSSQNHQIMYRRILVLQGDLAVVGVPSLTVYGGCG